MSTPHRWNTGFIRNYMVIFGLLSSVFDFLTFGTLIWIFQAEAATFRTGWFLESLLTELVIALVVRTRRPFWRSRPANLLLMTTAVVMMIALLLPYLPVNALFGFVPLPLSLVISMIVLTMAYVLAVEITKKIFYSRMAGT